MTEKIKVEMTRAEIDNCKAEWVNVLVTYLRKAGRVHPEEIAPTITAAYQALDIVSRFEATDDKLVHEARKAREGKPFTGPRPTTGPYAPPPSEAIEQEKAKQHLPPPKVSPHA